MKTASGPEPEIGLENQDPGLGTRDSGKAEMPLGQLRWRARRGLRELDLVLQHYLESRYPGADRDEQRAFALLLERSDPDIMDWVLGRAPPPAELTDVIRALASRN